MMYKVFPSKRFQRDLKRVERQGCRIPMLIEVVEKLAAGEKLGAKYKDHALTGDYAGCRECHIMPDWLLVYEIYEDELILYLTRTGTHSDLF